jgi:acetyl esterase
MPLDPQVIQMLRLLETEGGEPLERLTAREARLGDWSRNFVGASEDVKTVVHTFIPGPTADIPVRIYTPSGEKPLGAIVYFHGSAFAVSNIGMADSPHRAISNRTGCVVVAVNYQKAPEHKFPIPLDDCYAALRWVQDNAEILGVDASLVGVGGDSAGGNLAAAVCLKARDLGGTAIAFQLLIYPALDSDYGGRSMDENSEGYLLSSSGVQWAWKQYLNCPADGENPLASPLRALDLRGLPSAIVLTAEYDPLRDQGEDYAKRLVESGVLTISRRYDGMIHGFLWTAGVVEGSRRLLEDIGRDVQSMLNRESGKLEPTS